MASPWKPQPLSPEGKSSDEPRLRDHTWTRGNCAQEAERWPFTHTYNSSSSTENSVKYDLSNYNQQAFAWVSHSQSKKYKREPGPIILRGVICCFWLPVSQKTDHKRVSLLVRHNKQFNNNVLNKGKMSLNLELFCRLISNENNH